MAPTEPTITLEAALIDIQGLSAVLRRSIPSLERDDAAGRLPKPIRIGRSKRWRRVEILAWIDAGCPSRKDWEARPKRMG